MAKMDEVFTELMIKYDSPYELYNDPILGYETWEAIYVEYGYLMIHMEDDRHIEAFRNMTNLVDMDSGEGIYYYRFARNIPIINPQFIDLDIEMI